MSLRLCAFCEKITKSEEEEGEDEEEEDTWVEGK